MQGASTQFLGVSGEFTGKADRSGFCRLFPLVCSLCILSVLCTGTVKLSIMLERVENGSFFVLAVHLYV